MSEGPLDELQHGGSVLDFRAKAPRTAEMHQGLIDEQKPSETSSSTRDAIPWMARLTLGLPNGVVRHPLLLNSVQVEIARPCAIDVAHTGIAVSYTAEGETFEQACDDSSTVCEILMEHLGLDDDAIQEHVLVPADELPIWALLHRPSLRSLPDDFPLA